MECTCKKCGMGVKGVTCCKCDSKMVKDVMTSGTGGNVQVMKCPNGCGKVKSPTCCDHEMMCS